jgi:hypothetical protein
MHSFPQLNLQNSLARKKRRFYPLRQIEPGA